MKKYICFDGKVTSKDGDVHYINPHRVAELYKVNPKECYFAYHDRPETVRIHDFDLIVLHPRSDGDYRLKHLTN